MNDGGSILVHCISGRRLRSVCLIRVPCLALLVRLYLVYLCFDIAAYLCIQTRTRDFLSGTVQCGRLSTTS